MKKLIIILPLLYLTACSTVSKKSIEQEAKQQPAAESSAETKRILLDILNQDAKATPAEKQDISRVVEAGFSRYQELEILSNQKKSLLVKEYLSEHPNRKKIYVIKNAIKKAHAEKISVLMDSFDHIAAIMKLHPDAATRFFNSADRMWPMRERAQ